MQCPHIIHSTFLPYKLPASEIYIFYFVTLLYILFFLIIIPLLICVFFSFLPSLPHSLEVQILVKALSL